MKFKCYKHWKTVVASLGALALALAAQAQTITNPCPNRVISWNWDNNGTVNPTDLAGLAPATNWINSWPTPLTTDLPDNTGTATTLSFDPNVVVGGNSGYGPTAYSWAIHGSHPGHDANGTANKEMLNGYLNAGIASWNPPITNSFFALTNIPYASYDIVVYMSSDTAGRPGHVTDGTTTNYFATLGPAETSGANALFVPTTETNSANHPSADFAFFPRLTGNNKMVTCQMEVAEQWGGLAAIQVIESSNVYVLYGPNPASQTMSIGQPATFKVMAGGQNPAYQWRHAGTNILNATNATYSIASTTIGQDGNYDVVITNSFNSMTSSVATLTFYAPKTVTWDGNGSTWDVSSLYWTVNGGASTTNYADTDNVRFDPLGIVNSTVSLSDTLSPSSIVVSNASYTLTSSGTLGGSGSLNLVNNATLILDITDGRTGPTVIGSGSTFQVGNGGTSGVLGSGALTNNGALVLNLSGDVGYGLPIYGTGVITNLCSSGTVTFGGNVKANYLVQAGTGILLLQGSNTFSGGLEVFSGTNLARSESCLGKSQVVVAGGELQLVYGFDYAGPSMTLAGGKLHSAYGSQTFEGPVTLAADSEIDVDSGLTLNNAAGISGSGFNLTLGGGGGTLILAGTNNTWAGVNISAGTLQIGNGGGGSLGAGTITDEGALAFNLAGNLVVTNPITGGGAINQNGAGTVIFTGDASGLSGTTTVSAGGLGGTNTFGGSMDVLAGAKLAPGMPSTIGTLTINGSLTLAGNVSVKVNKSLVQSNDIVAVPGGASNSGNGAVIVNNLGPALAVGDKFTLFSSLVSGGDTMSVLGAGVIWTNKLAADGSISVLSTNVPKPVITNTVVSASELVFGGKNGYPGAPFAVLVSTNLTSPNWTVVAIGKFDGTGAFSVTTAITPGVPQAFYRLEQ